MIPAKPLRKQAFLVWFTDCTYEGTGEPKKTTYAPRNIGVVSGH
jgi:hypothetical protein